MARPFLKWAGGKGQLLSEITDRLPLNFSKEINTYVEPFLGGGAVFFRIIEKFKFQQVFISDINPELVLCYRTIQSDVEGVIKELNSLQLKYLPFDEEKRKEMYYSIRTIWNCGVGIKSLSRKKRIIRASQMIFMNRTCFNGLFRVNSLGKFNVPMGSYKNPRIVDEENLRSVSNILQNIVIENYSYEQCESNIDSATFVYFEPPYRPIDPTSSFTSYAKSGFNDDDQTRLGLFFSMLSKRNCKLMLSNSDPHDDFFDELYSEFKINRVLASRNINSVGSKRGKVNEIIVTNYEHDAVSNDVNQVIQAKLSQFEHDDQQ